jgi:tetratricopeptide (TPR) repeat protein
MDMTNNLTSSNSTTFPVNNNQTFIRNDKENKENITLLWFDSNNRLHEDLDEIKIQLQLINDYIIFHTDLDLCIKFIQSIKDEKIVFIASGSGISDLLSRVADLHQIDSIFIYSMEADNYQQLTTQYSKIIGIFSNRDELHRSIQEQINFIDQQLNSFSIFEHDQITTRYLSKQSIEFLWFQLFKQVIPQSRHNQQEMINVCRYYYRDNPKQLKLIDQFENEYRSEEAIQWYTKQSFVYKLVNKALINIDIDQLRIFYFFINDLSQNLIREHDKILSSEEKNFIAYRGVQLDTKDFNKLKQNQGKLISMNGYFLTTRLHSAACTFALKSTKRTNLISVLFQIECNLNELDQNIIFGDVSQFSEYSNEQQVLFDLNVVFRVESIEEDGSVQIIRMTPSSDGEMITKNYIEIIHQATEQKSIAFLLGILLCDIGKFHESQKYFEELLNDPKDADVAWIEFNIGTSLQCQNKLKEAREYYDRAYDRMIYEEPIRIKGSVYVLNNIGVILRHEGKSDVAHDYYQRALKISEKYYPPNDAIIAACLRNMARNLDWQGKFNLALEYFQRLLKFQEDYYPLEHGHIVRSLNDIGHVLYHQKKYDLSIEYQQRALKMLQKLYPFGHVSIGASLYTIGFYYEKVNKLEVALYYYQQALIVYEKFVPVGLLNRTLKDDIDRISAKIINKQNNKVQ